MIIDELLVKLGYEYDKGKLDDFHSDIDRAGKIAQRGVKAVLSIGTALLAVATLSSRATRTIGDTADELGVSVEKLSSLKFAFDQAGSGDAITFLRQVRSLALDAFEGVGAGSELFGRLGLSVRDASGQLKATTLLADELQASLNGSAQKDVLINIGGLTAFSRALSLTSSQYNAFKREGAEFGLISDEEVQQARDFQNSLSKLLAVATDLGREVVTVLTPTFVRFTQSLLEFIRTGKDIARGGLFDWLRGLTPAILTVVGAVGLLTVALLGLVAGQILSGLTVIASGIKAIGIGFALLKPAILVVGGITLAVVALVLAIEDIYTGLTGGTSVIIPLLSALGKSVNDFASDILGIPNAFASAFTIVSDFLASAKAQLGEWLQEIQAIPAQISKVFEPISTFFGFGGDADNTPSGGSGSPSLAIGSPQAPITPLPLPTIPQNFATPSRSSSKAINQTNSTSITINANASNAQEVARLIEQKIAQNDKDNYQRAEQEVSSGVTI